MRKLLSVMLSIVMTLSLAACAGNGSDRKASEIFNMLSEAFSDYTVEKQDSDSLDRFEFKSDYYVCTLSSGDNIFIYSFDSEKRAEKHASNYSADGSGYSWKGLFGNDYGMVIDYAYPVHFWLCGDCVIEYGGNDEIAQTLTELFGEQFAGMPIEETEPTLDDSQISFTVEYARVSVGETGLRPAEPIVAREALDDYCQALKDSYYWSPYTESYTDEFEAVAENYPAEWFENNSLIIVRTYSGSIPVEYTVENISFADGKYTVTVSSRAGGDTAIEEGCLFIALEGVKLSAESEIELASDYELISDNVEHGEQLTLEKLIELDESGKKLSWSDFEQYDSDDIGSGLYILRYFLRDRGYLMLIGGGSTEEEPLYIVLKYIYPDSEEDCEVGAGSVREFIERIGSEK